MTRNLTSELAAKKIGSLFDLVLVASSRMRDLRNGATPLVDSSETELSTALMEVEQGLIGLEQLNRLNQESPAKKKRRI